MKNTIIAADNCISSAPRSSELGLWQVKYKAEANYMDSCKFEGRPTEKASGSFEKNGEFITSVRAESPAESMSSGLTARDRSIKGIIFEKSDTWHSNIVFESDNINCQKSRIW